MQTVQVCGHVELTVDIVHHCCSRFRCKDLPVLQTFTELPGCLQPATASFYWLLLLLPLLPTLLYLPADVHLPPHSRVWLHPWVVQLHPRKPELHKQENGSCRKADNVRFLLLTYSTVVPAHFISLNNPKLVAQAFFAGAALIYVLMRGKWKPEIHQEHWVKHQEGTCLLIRLCCGGMTRLHVPWVRRDRPSQVRRRKTPSHREEVVKYGCSMEAGWSMLHNARYAVLVSR